MDGKSAVSLPLYRQQIQSCLDNRRAAEPSGTATPAEAIVQGLIHEPPHSKKLYLRNRYAIKSGLREALASNSTCARLLGAFPPPGGWLFGVFEGKSFNPAKDS